MNCSSGENCQVVRACAKTECARKSIGTVVKVTFIAPPELLDLIYGPRWLFHGPARPCPVDEPSCAGRTSFYDQDLMPLPKLTEEEKIEHLVDECKTLEEKITQDLERLAEQTETGDH